LIRNKKTAIWNQTRKHTRDVGNLFGKVEPLHMSEKHRRLTTGEQKSFLEDDTPVWAFDFVNHRMLWANDAALAFWKASSREEFLGRDYSSDSKAVRERLWQTINAIEPNKWARDSWTLFPDGQPTTVLIDAKLIDHENVETAILFRVIRSLDYANADPEGLRMMLTARVTPVAVSMFDQGGRLISENPAGLALRQNYPDWASPATDLNCRYESEDRAAEIQKAIEEDERITFQHRLSYNEKDQVLSVTARRIRDPVTGGVVAQITEEDITEQANLTTSLARLNEELESRVERRSQELAQLNERLREEIDRRKEAQREAEKERDFLRTLMEAIPVPIFYKNEEGVYLGCNKLWAEFMDLPKHEIIDQTVDDVLITDKGGAPRASDKMVGETEEPMQVVRLNGEMREVISYMAPFETLDRARGIIGTVIDVTDQKKTESDLRSRELILREATTATKTGFLVYDNETRKVEYATDTFQELVEASDKKFAKLLESIDNRFEVMDNAQGEEAHKIIKAAEIAGEPFEVSYQIKDGLAEGRWLLTKGYPLPGLGEDGTKRVSFIQDVTDTLTMENKLRQSQKLEAVGKLTGGIAHDFNNVLAVIQGNAELLGLYESFQGDLVEEIGAACNRGAELTRSLLAYARQQPLNAEVVNLGKRSRAIENILRRTLGADVNLSLSVSADLWASYVDAGQVEDAILNLALNARHAMPQGGNLIIELSNVTLDQPFGLGEAEDLCGDFVVISATDNGSGMSPDVLSKATDPFFTTKPVGQGSGLGLSMIYGFARQSGGNLTIYSEVDHGTTVKLYLPRHGMDEQIDTDIIRPDEIQMGNGEIILVVEDDPAVRKLVSRLLTTLNYEIVSFEAAQPALDHLESGHHVDLLLSDVVLPGGMKGPDLAKVVQKEFPELKILFMSGYPSEAAKQNGFIGSDSVLLNKPVKREQFATAISRSLRRIMPNS